MKYFPLLLLFMMPSVCSASYAQVCPLAAGCKSNEMVWLQIEPFGATLNPQLVALVVGGGLLLWGVGCGVGMYLQSLRKMR